MLEAMLEGWATQQRSRLLKATTVENRGFTVRRLVAFTNEYPWRWTPADVEEWTSQLVSHGLAHSTIRNYQMAVGLFLGYVCDARYGWAEICEQRFGTHPVQVFHEWNTAVHRSELEARPDRRPLSREELQRFFDHCDERVAALETSGRKGWLAVYRDAVLFKTIYGWGLRRTEAAMLDVTDWGPNSKFAQFGAYGVLRVRYGKASRGTPPRQRTVLTVMEWAAKAVAEWVDEIRPAYGTGAARMLWPTERAGRVSPAAIDARFAEYREPLEPGGGAVASLPAPLVYQPPARGRLRPAVRPATGGPCLGLDAGDIHPGRKQLHARRGWAGRCAPPLPTRLTNRAARPAR